MRAFKLLIFFILLSVPIVANAIDLSKIKIGGELRMRGYELRNVWDFNMKNYMDSWNVFRHRTNLFVSAELDKNIIGYIKIANQNFGEGVTQEKNWEEDNKSNKIFIDNAYININKIFNLPVNIRLGRQNLIYGSGFVLFDGQSQLASTSIYFDGIKIGWNISEKMNIDVLYFKDQENNRNNKVNDDITLSGAYLTSNYSAFIKKQELYFLRRNDEKLFKNIYMYGIRLSGNYDFGFDYSVELAIQKGDFTDEVKQNAVGCKIDACYSFNTFTQPKLFFGYVSLSGDAAKTNNKNEAWDVFYGGWPQFGDLLAWKYVNIGPGNVITDYDCDYYKGSSTGGEVVYSNLNISKAGLSVNILDKLTAKASFSKLFVYKADYSYSKEFGEYYQLNLHYQYSQNLSFAIYAGMIDPGKTFTFNNDKATELFWEAKLKF